MGSAMLAAGAGPRPAFALLQTVTPKLSFEESIATILVCQKILKPVYRYIEIGQYDPARTNVNYCTKILRLKKAMERAVDAALDFVDDMEKFEDAAEATAVYDNQLSQLDSSIYTLIFIPSDGESISPQALKFRKQAYEFYEVVMNGIDKVLSLASEKDLKEAEKIASKVDLPPFLFKEFKGDFYRPATP